MNKLMSYSFVSNVLFKNDRGIGRQYCKYHYEPIQQRLNILGILFINININSNSKTLTTITTPLNQNNLSLSNESIIPG